MKLQQVNIANFRSIKSLSIDFSQQCRILVGINESGKTNILKALSSLDPHFEISLKDIRNDLPDADEVIDESYIRFAFTLSEDDWKYLNDEYIPPILSTNPKSDFLYKYEGSSQSLLDFFRSSNPLLYCVDLQYNVQYVSCFGATDRKKKKYEFLSNWKLVSKICPADYTVHLTNGTIEALSDYKIVNMDIIGDDIPDGYLENINFDDLDELRSDILKERFAISRPSVISWKYVDQNLIPTRKNLNEFIADPNSCIPLRNMFELAGYTNIAETIEGARERGETGIINLLNRVATKTTEHFKAVWKEHGNISFRLSLDGADIKTLISENNFFELEQRSDGFKRFISFLLMISAKSKAGTLSNSLLLVDEPDISLHPKGARYLRDELINISKSNYVVYSTHSIFMIDKDILERHYIVKKEGETTSISEVNDTNLFDEEVLFQACGSSVFEIMKDKNVVFEGWRDKFLFNTALKKSTASKHKRVFENIGLAHAAGVKDMSRIATTLELANRNLLIVSDNDATAREKKKQFKEERVHGTWVTYEDLGLDKNFVTGEDFVKESHVKKAIDDIRPTHFPHITGHPNFSAASKIEAFDAWLGTNGITSKEDKKKNSNHLKTRIFETLEAKDIEDSYFDLITAISQNLFPTLEEKSPAATLVEETVPKTKPVAKAVRGKKNV